MRVSKKGAAGQTSDIGSLDTMYGSSVLTQRFSLSFASALCSAPTFIINIIDFAGPDRGWFYAMHEEQNKNREKKKKTKKENRLWRLVADYAKRGKKLVPLSLSYLSLSLALS